MKHFYILANPKYFKKAMGWDMKHNDIKYTNDNLVMSVGKKKISILLLDIFLQKSIKKILKK